jgi:oxygen-independent coproporphyrinogen-3 oxidase
LRAEKEFVAGVYISWPFCAQKCTYCNFASGVMPRELESRYVMALRREIDSHRWQWTPETVYLGGGTPSGMEPETITELLSFLPGLWRETTIEAAPGSLTSARVDAWIDAGINRVSLGVQSFVRQELARTGRKHTAETVATDVALLRRRGITNINIDLIAGLPSQTLNSWNASLDAALTLDPPHVSVYMLEVDDDSRLGSEIILGGLRYGAPDVPSEDSIADFYEIAADRLRCSGIDRYEISNFARPGSESLHNLKYWKREPYVGFGADAHSFDGTVRWQNVETAQEYVHRTERRDAIRTESAVPDADEERFFLGLRLAEGVHTDEADWKRHGELFDRLLSVGILERAGVNGNLRLTPRGIMVSNEVFEEFLNA